MKKSATAFFTTIFPSCQAYLDVFFESLIAQTDADFDLVIVNDNFKKLDCYIKKISQLNILEIQSTESPIQNRINGLQFIIDQGYKNIIFGDSDDYFSNNRVYVSKKLLQKNDILVNDITLFNTVDKVENIFNEFRFTKQDLIHKNIFGLSNTALKTKVLKNIKLKPEGELVAYDWYLFSLIVFQGFSFIFSSEAKTFYRQYEANTLGMSFRLNEKSLENLMKIKKMHLLAMKKQYSQNDKNEYYTIFENELKKFEELEFFLEKKQNKKDYITKINGSIEHIFKGWFSQLMPLNLYKTLNENTNK